MPKQTGSSTRLSSYKTSWHHDTTHNLGIVTYQQTRIVAWTPKGIILQTGGWDTATTRRKMNQASAQFGLGFRVWRHKGESKVQLPDGRTLPLGQVVIFSRHPPRQMIDQSERDTRKLAKLLRPLNVEG